MNAPTILVVEDEVSIRNNLALLLKVEGYDVRVAENGGIGLRMARERLPDLVLSDLMMPGMDGYELLAALRNDSLTAHLPVIMLTARADHQDIRQGMSLGADDYLPKPFQREDLLQAVAAQLGKSRGRQAAAARRLLHFDPLTGLPNHLLLQERLDDLLAQARANDESAVLFLIGLDDFGRINESLGRAVGDELLRETATRLFHLVERTAAGDARDGVARLEGDTFAAVLTGTLDDETIANRGQAIVALLAEPFAGGGGDQFLGASIGIACFPRDAGDTGALIDCAATALARAKMEGGKRLSFYAPHMNALAAERLALHNDLYRALERGEIELHYQPQVSIASGRLVGFEALMRWRHAARGMISPVQFIPIAEANGTIMTLGRWALEEACRQAADWRARGLGSTRMAVNLSARQFADDGLVGQVAAALAASGLPPECLELEITEGTAMQSGERTMALLRRLKELGVKLALDDFGTGYSSLAYLKRFPIDVLKIDQAFVRHMTHDAGDAAIARAVAALAKSFGLAVIAEGVETEAHLAHLGELGCDEYQGYYFSKPVPAAEAEALLAARA
jgi:diguanylate cyclase (GGDEF)-like protein